MQTPAPFEYERATSVDGAIATLAEHGPEARLIAGGHSLLPMMKLRLANPEFRQSAPAALPRSPVIGTDAPVQYEQRDDIGKPRKRMPSA